MKNRGLLFADKREEVVSINLSIFREEILNVVFMQKKKTVKLRCDDRFTHAFTACSCVFKEIALV